MKFNHYDLNIKIQAWSWLNMHYLTCLKPSIPTHNFNPTSGICIGVNYFHKQTIIYIYVIIMKFKVLNEANSKSYSYLLYNAWHLKATPNVELKYSSHTTCNPKNSAYLCSTSHAEQSYASRLSKSLFLAEILSVEIDDFRLNLARAAHIWPQGFIQCMTPLATGAKNKVNFLVPTTAFLCFWRHRRFEHSEFPT
jgi:hypothetical protein